MEALAVTSLTLERDDALARIAAACDRAAAGDGAVVLIEGPAGIGKTRLVADACTLATARGFGRLQATADELESAMAWSVVHQMLDRALSRARGEEREAMLAGPVGAALDAVATAPDDAAAGEAAVPRTLHALWWVAADLAAVQPLIIAIDDAQWADLPSLRFLAHLARRIADVPIVLVVATRPVSAREGPLAQLRAAAVDELILPEPLSPAGVATLGERHGVSPDAEVAEAIHAATGGNPLLARLLIDDLRARGTRLEDAAAAAAIAGAGPSTIARAVLVRLPANATALAAGAAVLGARSDPRIAGEVAGLRDGPLRSAIDALVIANVAVVDGDEMAFVHPVVREAVLAELGPGERAGLHAGAARTLQAAGAPVARIAVHLALAPLGTLPDAAAVLRAAAEGLLADGDAATAAARLELAVAEAPGDDALRAALGSALLRAGAPGPAREHLRAAAAQAGDDEARAERLASAAAATAQLDGPEAAMAELHAVLDDWPGPATGSARLILEARLATISFHRHGGGHQSTQHLRRFAGLPGATPQERTVLALLAQRERYDGGAASEVAGVATRALAEGAYLQDVADGADQASGWFVAVMSLISAEAVDTARAELDRARARVRRRGSPLEFAMVSNAAGWLAWRTGDLVAAETETAAALAAVATDPDVGDVSAVRATATHVGVLAALERGDVEAARAALEAFDAAVEDAAPVIPVTWLGEARVRVQLAGGDAAGAHHAAVALGERLRAAHLDVPTIPWRATAAVAALHLGDTAQALALAGEQLDVARRWATATDVGAALHLGARVDAGRRIELLAEAVAVLEPSPARLELAGAVVDHGESLRIALHRIEARAQLRRGADLAVACGAPALQRRALDGLAALGDRPRTAAFSGEDALTAGERRVAQLARDGQSNREIAHELFITPKTVENHLGRVYLKLDIKGRHELGAALAAQG